MKPAPGLVAGGKFCCRTAPAYIVAQLVGAVIGAGIIYLIASGKTGFDVAAGFAANGYGEHSPDGYGQKAAFIGGDGADLLFWWSLSAQPMKKHRRGLRRLRSVFV